MKLPPFWTARPEINDQNRNPLIFNHLPFLSFQPSVHHSDATSPHYDRYDGATIDGFWNDGQDILARRTAQPRKGVRLAFESAFHAMVTSIMMSNEETPGTSVSGTEQPGISGAEPANEDPIVKAILDATADGATASPDAIARQFAVTRQRPADPADKWRTYLTAVRQQIVNLARQGRIEILRKGKPIDPAKMKGLIKVRRTV